MDYIIGHAAYVWPNSRQVCTSRSEAILELRYRGVRRDEARRMAQRADDQQLATGYGGRQGTDVVEMCLG